MTRTIQPPAPRIIRNTVHQTVVHLHQTTHQHIQSRITAGSGGRDRSTLLVCRSAAPPAQERALDPSRPAQTARRLLRILSMESARQTMRPFYLEMFRGFWAREREEYRGRPAQSLLLVERVLGRQQALHTLRRFCRRTLERLDGTILYSRIFHRYVRLLRQDVDGGFIHRYIGREAPVPEDLRRLSAAKRSLPPRQPPPEQKPGHEPQAEPHNPAPPAGGFRLSGSDFQLLVRGVADALGRRSRLESLRRGGM